MTSDAEALRIAQLPAEPVPEPMSTYTEVNGELVDTAELDDGKRAAPEEPADEPPAKKTKSDEEGKETGLDVPMIEHKDERTLALELAQHTYDTLLAGGVDKTTAVRSKEALMEVLGVSDDPATETTLRALRRLESLSLDEQEKWVQAGLDIKAVVSTLKDAKESLKSVRDMPVSAETKAESIASTMTEVHGVIALIDKAEADATKATAPVAE